MTKLAVTGDDIHLDAGAANITHLQSGETAVLILAFATAVTHLVMMREGVPSMFFGALEQIKTGTAPSRTVTGRLAT